MSAGDKRQGLHPTLNLHDDRAHRNPTTPILADGSASPLCIHNFRDPYIVFLLVPARSQRLMSMIGYSQLIQT